jgi:hypothetical protein
MMLAALNWSSTDMVRKIRRTTLPLFLTAGLIAPFTRRRFGFLGPQVVPGLVLHAGKVLALAIGATLGRARPDLVGPMVGSLPYDPGRNLALSNHVATLEARLVVYGDPGSFEALVVPDRSLLRTVVDADAALEACAVDLLVGLSFGARHPELTRRLFEKDVALRQWIRILQARLETLQLDLETGLWLPVGPLESYEEWEQYYLSLLDDWQRRWGPQSS